MIQVRVDKHLSIDPQLWRTLKSESVVRSITLSELVAQLCIQGLNKRHKNRRVMTDG
jgi:hypothetical protein